MRLNLENYSFFFGFLLHMVSLTTDIECLGDDFNLTLFTAFLILHSPICNIQKADELNFLKP